MLLMLPNLCKKLTTEIFLLAETIKLILNFSNIRSAVKFDEEASLLLVLDRHRDRNLEVILVSNSSNNLFVKISLALGFDNLIAFFTLYDI